MIVIQLARRSFRQFVREPLYAIASATTLALAVAAAVASFAVVKPALLDPLPYRSGNELVSLLTQVGTMTSATSALVLADLESASPPLAEIAPVRPATSTFEGQDTTESLPTSLVTASYFSLLGAQPALGRFFQDDETDAVVISARLWQTRFAADPSVVGRRIRLNGADRAVVGVMPASFFAPYWPATDVWMALDMAPLLKAPSRGVRQLTVLARRTAPQADVDAFLTVFTGRMRRDHPTQHGQQAWVAIPLRDELVGPARPALLGTAAAALLLLTIVCANIAGLSAVRAVVARRQVAVRAALGATAGRLLAERVADSLAIAVVGSLAGVWLAGGLVTLLAGYQQQFLERISPIALDGWLVAFGVAAGTVSGLAAAVMPSKLMSGGAALDALHVSRGGTGDRAATAWRSSLVVGQVALALVLVAGAGLLVQTVRNLSTMPLGFESADWTMFSVNLSARYDTEERQIQFERDVVEALRRLPGISDAHASVGVPVIGGMMAALRIQGEPPDAPLSEIAYMSLAPGFMEAMGVQLTAGRQLSADDHAGAPNVVVINETMARKHWPAGDAVGAQVYIGPGTPGREWITVVGVVADVRQHGPTLPVRPHAFGTTLQYSFPRRNFILKTAAPSATLAADVRAAVRQIDPALAISGLQPLDQVIADRMARHRLVMLALTVFGVVALVLSVFGLYAVVALSSQSRRREYAIRVALGAPRAAVRRLVLGQGVRLAAAGTAAGLALAVVGTRLLQGLLHGVEPLDAATFSGAIVVVLALSLTAALLPALRASRVNAAEVLNETT
jgi:putative ABC transport system permease protein